MLTAERCCSPGLDQPNLALELELADYILTKRANTAREAAFEVVHKVNSRFPHVGMLALHVRLQLPLTPAARHSGEKLWIPDPSADRHERVFERACAALPGTSADASWPADDQDP